LEGGVNTKLCRGKRGGGIFGLVYFLFEAFFEDPFPFVRNKTFIYILIVCTSGMYVLEYTDMVSDKYKNMKMGRRKCGKCRNKMRKKGER
jgi:hypothetical protein